MVPKSKSSDGDSKEPMETDSSSIGEKRKAETMNPEDSGEQEGGAENEGGGEYEEEAEEEVDIEELCKWGYDSFQDLSFHSSDLSEHSDKEIENQWRYYLRHVFETQGFFESFAGFPKFRIGGFSKCRMEESAGRMGTTREFCTKLTSVCVNKYNEEHKEKIELDSVLRANYIAGSLAKFYITFLAKEFDGSLVEYQAKAVWCLDEHDTIYPILCRPTTLTKPSGVSEGTQGEKAVPART